MLALYDAHVHLAAPKLAQAFDSILIDYEAIQLAKALCVGTSPHDWPHVQALAAKNSRILPAVGLHPWQVNQAPDDWRRQFDTFLSNGIRIIGEIGLDQWIEGYQLDRQIDAFHYQFQVAARQNLACSIHCLKAIGPLMDYLRRHPLPARGFKIHAYNGPIELVPELCEMGAYFSMNAGQLKHRNSKAPQRIQAIPLERLLIETDAPDFLPHPQHRPYHLPNPTQNHPANLHAGYRAIATVLEQPLESLTQQIAANFHNYFGAH